MSVNVWVPSIQAQNNDLNAPNLAISIPSSSSSTIPPSVPISFLIEVPHLDTILPSTNPWAPSPASSSDLAHSSMAAFATPKFLRVPKPYRPYPRRCQRRMRLAGTKNATIYTTGKKVLLHLSNLSDNEPMTAPYYIVCPTCNSAYIGNAVTSTRMQVSCPKCKTTFPTSRAELYTTSPPDKKLKKNQKLDKDAKNKAIKCKHMTVCPGCQVSGPANRPSILSDVRNFMKKMNTKVSIEMGNTKGWRTHAKLAVRSESDGPSIGLFRARSHDIVRIPECSIQAPEINAMSRVIESTLREGRVKPYCEKTGNGNVRYVIMTVHRETRAVQVTLVWNSANWKESMPMSRIFATELIRRSGRMLHSLWFNWNVSSGNVIASPEIRSFYKVRGEEMLVERVHGVDICFPPYAFRQANLDAFEKLILPRVLTYIPAESSVAEFCAGVGLIGLVALKNKNLRRLVASEIHEGGKRAFEQACKKLPKDIRRRAEYVVASDSEAVETVDAQTNIVIVDPPRSGLSSDFVEYLANPQYVFALSRIIYLSCGFEAFKRDSKALCDGQWKLITAHAYILFPGSDQIETLAIFDRVRKKSAAVANVRQNTRVLRQKRK